MTKTTISNEIPADLEGSVQDVSAAVHEFADAFKPLESNLRVLVDARTNARFCECHIRASKFVPQSTIDVPLDPEEQSDYRANREIVEDHAAFRRMQSDALERRAFSNIVAEYTDAFQPEYPLKIIGGQHRFEAIRQALDVDVDEYHGIKVYFELGPDQRLDVQLISNTNIAVSTDLLDRMYETVSGPGLRDWCQKIGLLQPGVDFADRRQRGEPITVRAARTFILNHLNGRAVASKNFDQVKTTPIIAGTGGDNEEWNELKTQQPKLWEDPSLAQAGQEFAALIGAQHEWFEGHTKKGRVNVDYAEKALNMAVLSAWAFVAGVLHENNVRLKRHYELRKSSDKDPLNAAVLAKGRHKTDPENYRGLGYRTDAKERGRFAELFYVQAEKGSGISKPSVDLAIKKYHAKQAILDVLEAEAKA